MQITPLRYAPDEDTAWLANPGACSWLNGFAPMNRGSYGTVGTAAWIGSSGGISGGDVLHAQLFRKVAGTVRLLVFRDQNIDEYDNAATRTNQGFGYSASTTDWTAASWGDQVIATNYYDPVQSSTGSSFSDLAGTPPKARLVAANELHVMLADYDDGTNQYADGYASSALMNPTSWTASTANQSARNRLYSPPGPIRALVPWKNKSFVAFKDNSVHLIEYVGGDLVFTARTLSASIGCHSAHGVVALGEVIYFYHSSGFWAWDGSNFVDVGKSVINKFNQYAGYTPYADTYSPMTSYSGPAKVQAVADDIENLVVFCVTAFASTSLYQWTFALNTATGKWGRWMEHSGAVANDIRYIAGSTADAQTFKSNSAARLPYIYVGASSSSAKYFGYPLARSALYYEYTGPSIETGMIGDYDIVRMVDGVYVRDLQNGQQFSVEVDGLSAENWTSIGGATGVANTELMRFDLRVPGKFHKVTITPTASTACEIAGIGISYVKTPTGTR